jgi:hypothetical protein
MWPLWQSNVISIAGMTDSAYNHLVLILRSMRHSPLWTRMPSIARFMSSAVKMAIASNKTLRKGLSSIHNTCLIWRVSYCVLRAQLPKENAYYKQEGEDYVRLVTERISLIILPFFVSNIIDRVCRLTGLYSNLSCSSCKCVYYSSSALQKEDWAKRHKKECPVLKALKESKGMYYLKPWELFTSSSSLYFFRLFGSRCMWFIL